MSTATARTFACDAYIDAAHARRILDYRSTALIRLGGTIDEVARQRVIRDVRQLHDVRSARMLREKPAMLLVSYIAGELQAADITGMLHESGIDAVRVC